MKINPEHFKGAFDHSPHFLTSKEMSGDVKSVVLSWQASVRTCEKDKDGDLSAFLCKIGICSRFGEIPKFLPTSANLQSLFMVAKMHSNGDISGKLTSQEKIMLSFSVDYYKTTISGLFLLHCMIEHI